MALFVKVCVFPGCEVNTTNLRASQPFLIKAPCVPSCPASCPVTGSTPALQPQKPLSGAPPAPLHLPPQPRGENAQVAQRQRIHLPLQERWVHPWVGKIPWRRKRQPTPVFLPGKCHGQRSLAGHKPRVAKSPTGLGAHTSETSAPPGPLLSRHFLSSFSAAPSFAPLKGETKEGYTHWNHLSDCFSLPDCEQKESWSSLYK